MELKQQIAALASKEGTFFHTGVIHVVPCADAGAIVSPKTAESQMIGGAVGGNNLADYHVPVECSVRCNREAYTKIANYGR